MPHATGLFLPVLIIWLIADIVSGESTRGTIKLLLVRPVSRVKILLGKWATSLTVTALLTFCFFSSLLATNLLLYGINGAEQPRFVNVDFSFTSVSEAAEQETIILPIPHFSEALVIPEWQYSILSMLFALLAMMTIASITFLSSTLFKSPMVSAGTALAAVIAGYILVQKMEDGRWLFWLFSVHLNPGNNWSGQLSANLKSDLSLGTGVTVLSVWTGISLLTAIYYFRKKDILNA
ncbi:ABC transporter permease [Melghirimyces thermohalophilus]|nr:ABC transporter permease [Melghirimyces thermohalophilus]